MSTKKGWIGVDLDGTLAHYDGWIGIEHIGAPILPMVERVKQWLAAGQEVRIFTARVDGGTAALAEGNAHGEAFRDVSVVKHHIEQWCLRHLGTILPITNVKDYSMVQLWDDRAVQVQFNRGIPAESPPVSASLTPIERAAKDLSAYLRWAIAPHDAKARDDEWPVSINVDNEEDGLKLAQLLQNLEDNLAAAGHNIRS